jgi:hypothetical protein
VGALKIKGRPASDRAPEGSNNGPGPSCTLARDLDGNVHTPAGFLPANAYRKIRDENPSAGLPAYEDLGLLDG